MRICSQFKPYNNLLPCYLHDRPPSLIDHCIDRMKLAAEIEKECIQMTDEEQGSFKVKSLDPDNQGRWYDLSFGDDETLPHCECTDWEKHRLPCKHFLAVFSNFKGWGFDKFPAHYRESPFLTLDKEFVFLKQVPINTVETEVPVQEDVVTATHVTFDEKLSALPERQKASRTWNSKCKEAIKQVTSLTHIVDDTESLKEVYTLLHECITILTSSAQKEEGIVLEKPQTSSKSGNQPCFKEIPKAKSRQPFSGRHGERAEIMKRTYKVNLDVTAEQHVPKRAKKSDCNIECEIVSMDLDGPDNNVAECREANSDVIVLEKKSTHDSNPANESNDKEAPQGESTISDNPGLKVEDPHDHPYTTVSNADVIVVDETSPDPDVWVEIPHSNGKLTLYPANKDNILSPDGWLIDKEITASQILLKNNFLMLMALKTPQSLALLCHLRSRNSSKL